MKSILKPILAKNLVTLHSHQVKHGFFTRQEDVSTGLYQQLNITQSSSNHSEHITKNHKLITDYFGIEVKNLVTVRQIHSCEVVVVDQVFIGEPPEADALVTTVKGLAIGVITADCGPVLFADPQAGVIGAAHAGWRGSLNGILEKTISTMEEQGAKRQSITAVLGPCIGPRYFEVTSEFYDQFINCHSQFKRYFLKTADHFSFNLWAFITDRLKKAGVNASCVELCTYQHAQHFFLIAAQHTVTNPIMDGKCPLLC